MAESRLFPTIATKRPRFPTSFGRKKRLKNKSNNFSLAISMLVRKTDRQRNRETERQRDREKEGKRERKTERQRDKG